MKILKIFVLSLLVFVLLCGSVFFIYFQRFDAERYLSGLSQKASFLLGRPVTIAGAWLGLSWKGMTIEIGPVVAADNPDFTSQPFIKIERVRICPDWGAFFVKRKFEIASIVLISPQIHFIRSRDGSLNIKMLGRQGSSGQPTAVVPGAADQTPATGHALSPLSHRDQAWSFHVKSFRIKDGAVSYIDLNPRYLVDIWLNGINVRARDVSLSRPFEFSSSAAFYSDVPNVRFSGKVEGLQPLVLSDLNMRADFTHLNMKDFKAVSPAITDSFNLLNESLSGALSVFGMEGSMSALLSSMLKDKLGIKDIAFRSLEARGAFRDNTFSVNSASVMTNIFEFNAKGTIRAGTQMDLDTQLHLNPDVSSAFVGQFKAFGSLMDQSQRITVGASLTGEVPHVKYKPNKDFRKKSRKAFFQEGGNILGVLLGGR